MTAFQVACGRIYPFYSDSDTFIFLIIGSADLFWDEGCKLLHLNHEVTVLDEKSSTR